MVKVSKLNHINLYGFCNNSRSTNRKEGFLFAETEAHSLAQSSSPLPARWHFLKQIIIRCSTERFDSVSKTGLGPSTGIMLRDTTFVSTFLAVLLYFHVTSSAIFFLIPAQNQNYMVTCLPKIGLQNPATSILRKNVLIINK